MPVTLLVATDSPPEPRRSKRVLVDCLEPLRPIRLSARAHPGCLHGLSASRQDDPLVGVLRSANLRNCAEAGLTTAGLKNGSAVRWD